MSDRCGKLVANRQGQATILRMIVRRNPSLVFDAFGAEDMCDAHLAKSGSCPSAYDAVESVRIAPGR